MAFTLVAAAIYALKVLPGQSSILAEAAQATAASPMQVSRIKALSLFTGVFALAVVVVLMVFRPGSTAGHQRDNDVPKPTAGLQSQMLPARCATHWR
jgi:hypothetical protein